MVPSFSETEHVFSGKAVIKLFSLIDVLRTPYRDDIIQSVYFKLDSFEESFNVSDDVKYLRSVIDEACHMREYQLLFPVENQTTGSGIACCINKLKDEIND